MILQTKLPEAIVTAYSKRPDTASLIEALAWADVIVAGPGLGCDENAEAILKNVLKNAGCPGGIGCGCAQSDRKGYRILLKPHTDMVVTPLWERCPD